MSEAAELASFVTTPYAGYTYSYPHKTAHRPLNPAVPLRELWANQKKDALSLYLHVPFCLSRCAYCNLFSLSSPPSELPDKYLAVLGRQAKVVRECLGTASFSRLAIGGGTPTLLTCRQLESLIYIAKGVMGADPVFVPTSVEVSPSTVTAEKIGLLRAAGVRRFSIGVQTFGEEQARCLGRRQAPQSVHRAIETIRSEQAEVLNIDLMYGIPGQNLESWKNDLRQALRHRPEELFLYPLYVRPLTPLGAKLEELSPWLSQRQEAYRVGRSLLLEAGYQQVSMRMFRLTANEVPGPQYSCQEDGMVGLGCGPRSYTSTLHYSSRYAVSQKGVQEILNNYLAWNDSAFASADHGIHLGREDQCRRWVLQSLLRVEGMSRQAYRAKFQSDVIEDLPELELLSRKNLMVSSGDRVVLTELGIELSDAIGPWLYSQRVRELMEGYSWQRN